MALMRRWAGIKSCLSSDCEGEGEMAVLDLRHCSLSSVPTDVFKAEPNLEEIYLDANQIRELPRALFGLQNLHVLGLSDNELTVLPSAVSNLVNLREVDISKNGIIDLPESVKNCKSLEQFDASVNPIGKVPDGFTQLLNLTHVYLNDAFLDRLPSNFGRLSKLKVLELRENHLKNLPESMSYFTQLERLDIGSNEFMELPAVVGCLINLKELWMDCNGVRELPPEIGLLRRLLFLDVSKNRLERLPPEIESLQSLTDLYLSNNFLLELLDSIGALGNLQTLKVDENHLVELPFSIGRLHKLEELVASHNELESLPSSIGSLKKLRVLYADENFLEAIPIELGGCTSVTVLSLHDNKLVRIPDDIGRMPNLQVINLSSNRLVCLPYTFRKLTNLKALWLSENQSKPMIPLQSEFDHGTQSHVLTCFMFPQQPPADEVSLQYSEDSGSIPASLLEEQVRLRSSIVFNIDEDDYLAKLARFQSPYPKDVKDRVAQYFASRRQHQQETEVSHPPSQHRCSHQEQHQCRHNQYEHKVRHSQNPSHNTQNLQTRQSHQEQLSRKPVMVVLQAAEPIQPPVPLRPQEVSTVEVPWYEDQPQVLDETSEHRQSQQIGVAHPMNTNHQETSTVVPRQRVGAREESVNSSIPCNMNVQAMRRSQVSMRSSPEERVIGGQMAVEEMPATQNPPKYQPPPPYTPRDNRPPPPPLSEDDRRQSLETQHSFREEAPSSSSSYWGRPLRGLGSRSSENTANSEHFSELHSFNEEEPSFIQGPLRPPSYYEATDQSDRVPFENTVHHVFNSSQSEHNRVVSNVHRTAQNVPPSLYTTQFEFPPEQGAVTPTEACLNISRQPVALVRPDIISETSQRRNISNEDAQRFENQVRQLQRERALERREMPSMQAQTLMGDNVRSLDNGSSRPLIRTNSSESRTSDQSVSSSQDNDEPLDNDPTVVLHQVEIYKNPNLGFSIGGGVGSSSNPFDPSDNKSIYVTKVQADGPASFGLIPGDRILEVNGINLRRVTHEKAVMFLKHNQVVNLLIARKKDL